MMCPEFAFKTQDIDDEFHRVIKEQLEHAIASLTNASFENQTGVHEARKSMKRLRACFRLVKNHYTYLQCDQLIKEAAGRLSAIRDSEVILQTFNSVLRDNTETAVEEDALELYWYFQEQAVEAAAQMSYQVPGSCSLLKEGLARVMARPDRIMGKTVFLSGLRKSYSSCRKKWSLAERSQRDTDFHKWRKAVKNHLYQLQLVTHFSPKINKRVRKWDDLAETLGDFHDLSVLKEKSVTEASYKALALPVKQRQEQLLKKANTLAKVLLAENPRDYIVTLENLMKR